MNRGQLAATADPGVFTVYASGGTWETAAHLEHMDSLRDVAAGVLLRLVVFAPPRHGKSELLKYFVAWSLGRFPDKTVIVASHDDDLATDFGRAVRSILNVHGRELFGVEVASDSAAVNRFGIEGYDGGLYAVGVGGSVTGRGADLVVVDDVIKSDVEVVVARFTEEERVEVWDRWQAGDANRLIGRDLGRSAASIRAFVESWGGVRPRARSRSLRPRGGAAALRGGAVPGRCSATRHDCNQTTTQMVAISWYAAVRRSVTVDVEP